MHVVGMNTYRYPMQFNTVGQLHLDCLDFVSPRKEWVIKLTIGAYYSVIKRTSVPTILLTEKVPFIDVHLADKYSQLKGIWGGGGVSFIEIVMLRQ